MDLPSKEMRSGTMKRIKSKNTTLELKVRRLLFSMGYRYRIHVKSLPGSPDIVFPGRKKIIFINGCFWHQHRGCTNTREPKTNVSYWKPKLERNIQRDIVAIAALEAAGWKCLILWECEINKHDWLPPVINFLNY